MAQIHQLFARRASYGPDRLKVLGNAFDDAWQTLGRNIGAAPAEIDRARMTLASVILNLPCSEIADAESIKNAALQVMAARANGRKPNLASPRGQAVGPHLLEKPSTPNPDQGGSATSE
jgi:hypothetical protein